MENLSCIFFSPCVFRLVNLYLCELVTQLPLCEASVDIFGTLEVAAG